MKNNELIGVVILNYNDAITTVKLVDSIYKYSSISNVVIVDNNSSDNSMQVLRGKYAKIPKIDLIESQINGGYGAGNNLGINYLYEKYGIRYQIICNPDVSFDESTVKILHKSITSLDRAAVVAPLMIDREGKINKKCVWSIPSVWQYSTFQLRLLSRFSKSFYYTDDTFNMLNPWKVGCVAGSMFMLDVECFETSKLYDENIFLYCEETVLGIKTRNMGCLTYLIPECQFLHLHSVSISKSFPKEIERYRLMWKSRLYVLKTYMGASSFSMIIARASMGLFFAEKKLKNLIIRG